MRSLARALSSSRRPPPNAASKPCSAIASSSVTLCSRLRLARGPSSSTTRRCRSTPARWRRPGARRRARRTRRGTRSPRGSCGRCRRASPGTAGGPERRPAGEVQQHGGVLAAAEQQHRVLALGRDLADDRDGLVGEVVRGAALATDPSCSYVQPALGLGVAGPAAGALVLAGRRPGGCTASSRSTGSHAR